MEISKAERNGAQCIGAAKYINTGRVSVDGLLRYGEQRLIHSHATNVK